MYLESKNLGLALTHERFCEVSTSKFEVEKSTR